MRYSEFDWVNSLRKKAKKGKHIVAGIGDDCAVIKDGKEYLLVSTDLSIDGVHFQSKKMSYATIGERAASRALSDIAACCGRPAYVLVSAGIPSRLTPLHMQQLLRGIRDAAGTWNAVLIGGDTSRSTKLFLDICVIGRTKNPLLRSTAKTGDYIFLTGTLGALPFDNTFTPRVKEALYIGKHFKVNAMIDISDGFIIDLSRILKESGKGALLWKDKIPVSRRFDDVYGGEDYELIFTIDKKEPRLKKLMNRFYLVGRIKSKGFGYWIDEGRSVRRARLKGYLHF